MPISTPSHAGKVINGRYRLITPLGTGSKGQVYLADDIRQRRQVAVKVFHDAYANDHELLEHFRGQAQVASSLNHPNIVTVHDWGDSEIPFLVSEYLGGGTLRGVLMRESSLTLSQAVVVGIEISEGLNYAHNRGIIQRELKPEKIIFDVEGRLKLADFGLAQTLSGSPAAELSKYASPEQIEKKSVGTGSDIYSLALVLYEAVTGEIPVGDGTPIVPPKEIFGSLTPAITQALSHEPSSRPDAESLRDMLVAASKDLSRPDSLPIESGLDVSVVTPATPDPTGAGEPIPLTFFNRIKGIFRYVTSRLKRWSWLLLMVAITAGIISLVYATNEEEIINVQEVPEAIGLIPETFIAQVNNFWELEEALTREDGSIAGTILKTIPPSGELLEEGETITYFVSQGPEIRDIPLGLVGLTIQEAEASLLGAQLTLGVTTQQPDEEIAAGLVAGVINPIPELPTGSPVDLIISSGPELRTIPDGLEGNSYEDAETAIVLEGLKVRKQEMHHPSIAEGIVISLSPPPGEKLQRDSFVDVIVSLGPEPVS